MSLEDLFVTQVVDEFEEWDVSNFDIPGTYLHALLPDGKQVTLKFKGVFVDIVCQINEY